MIEAETVNLEGIDFFDYTCRYINQNTDVDYTYIARYINSSQHLISLSTYSGDNRLQSIIYNINNTPCNKCIKEGKPVFIEDLSVEYPNLFKMVEMYTYVAHPIINPTSNTVEGAIVSLFSKKTASIEQYKSILEGLSEKLQVEWNRNEAYLTKSESSRKKMLEENKTLLDAVADHSEVAVIIDLNFIIIDICGYNPYAIKYLNTSFLNYSSAEQRDYVVQQFNSVIETGAKKVFNVSYVYNGRLNDYKYYRLYCTPLKKEGKIEAIVIGRTPIAKGNRVESELNLIENNDTSIEGSNGAFFITDNDIILDANKRLQNLLGYTKEELIGANALDLIVLKAYHSVIEHKRLNNIRTPYEVLIRKKNGQVLEIMVSSSLIEYQGRTMKKILFLDITDQKININKIAKALEESEVRYKTFSELTNEAIVIHINGNIIDVNHGLVNLSGYSRNELITTPISEHIYSEDMLIGLQALESETEDRYEIRLKKKSGEIATAEIHSKSIRYNNEKASVLILRDITSIKKTQRDLLKSEAKYKRIFNSLIDVYFRTDNEGNLIEISPSAKDVFDRTPEQLLGRNVAHFYTGQKKAPVTFTQKGETKPVENFSFTINYGTGKELYVEGSGLHIYDEDGEFVGMEGMVRDVTQKIKNQNELALKRQELSNQRIQHFILGQEEERKRVARELHDSIGQELTSIKMMTDDLLINDSVEKRDALSKYINRVIGEVKQISESLSPSMLIELGLIKSINNLCKDIEWTSGIEIYSYLSFEEAVVKDIELDVYRITQELLNNSAKHSQATEINLTLILRNDIFTILFEDNGIGFDEQKTNSKSRGLINMKERTNSRNGTFIIDSTIDQGVTITIEIPII